MYIYSEALVLQLEVGPRRQRGRTIRREHEGRQVSIHAEDIDWV